MVRYLSKDDYGLFLQILLISNTVTMLAFFGLPHSVYYFYSQTTGKINFIKQTVLLSFLISLLAALIVYCLCPTIASLLNNPRIIHFSVIISIAILFDGPLHFSEAIFFSQRLLRLSFLSNIIFALINYIPLIIGMSLGFTLKELVIVLLVSKITNFVVFLTMLYYSFRFIETSGSHENKYKKVGIFTQLKYALPLGIASQIGIVNQEIDKYFISIFFTPAQFAIYSRGAMQIPLISNIQYVINDIRMVDYVRCYRENNVLEFIRIMHSAIDKVAKINYAVFFFLFANATLLVKCLYTEQYLNAVPIFRVYLIFLIITVSVYGLVPRASGHTKYITYATVISLCMNVTLSPILIYCFGPIGAAFATTLTLVTIISYYLIVSSKLLRVSFFHIMPWFRLFRIFIVSFVSIVPVCLLQYILEPQSSFTIIIFLVLSFICYVYFYLFGLSFFNLMYKDDWQFIRRWIRFDVSTFVPKSKNRQTEL